jgi:hypothetical protein
MALVFYNTFGIGDAFFLKPLLQGLCKANPGLPISLYTRYGSVFFKDIPGLTHLDTKDAPPEDSNRLALYNLFYHYREEPLVKYDTTHMFVNTWVAVWNKYISPENCECYPERLYQAFQKCLQDVNQHLENKLTIPVLEKRELIYTMPELDIRTFLEFKKTAGKKLIYYFNRTGCSADTKPFVTELDQVYILHKLSELVPDALILVPNLRLCVNRENIIPTSLFGIQQTYSSENVLYETELAGYCDYAIQFDVGASLTYCNSHFPLYTATFLHCSKNNRYCELLRETMEHCLDISCPNLLYVPCSTPDEFLKAIQPLLS